MLLNGALRDDIDDAHEPDFSTCSAGSAPFLTQLLDAVSRARSDPVVRRIGALPVVLLQLCPPGLISGHRSRIPFRRKEVVGVMARPDAAFGRFGRRRLSDRCGSLGSRCDLRRQRSTRRSPSLGCAAFALHRRRLLDDDRRSGRSHSFPHPITFERVPTRHSRKLGRNCRLRPGFPGLVATPGLGGGFGSVGCGHPGSPTRSRGGSLAGLLVAC